MLKEMLYLWIQIQMQALYARNQRELYPSKHRVLNLKPFRWVIEKMDDILLNRMLHWRELEERLHSIGNLDDMLLLTRWNPKR